MQNRIAIIDFGTNKIKFLLCDKINDEVNYSDFSEEIFIGKLFNTELDEQSKKSIIDDFQNKITTNIEKLYSDNYHIIAIATEIFRTNKEINTLLKNLSEKFNFSLEIIDGNKEGLLLASNFDLNDNTILTDIGGRSSQLIYKTSGETITDSYKLGSYKLMSLFQPNGKIITNDIYEKMNDYIKKTIRINKHFSSLIVGSNLMLDFFNSISKISNLNFMNNNYFDSNIVEYLINELFLNKKYEELFQYFPQNPNFMYGADKMLILLKNYIEIFGIQIVHPTNASITTGLAKLYFEQKI